MVSGEFVIFEQEFVVYPTIKELKQWTIKINTRFHHRRAFDINYYGIPSCLVSWKYEWSYKLY